ncbi:hypothetical protein Hanom_Chr04g00328671 [Helianthus anomalus]
MGERKSKPPASPVNPTIHIQDDPKKTPEEQPKKVEDPSSAKKATTSSSSHGFPKVIGEYPEDLPEGDFDILNEGKLNMLTKKVIILEKVKAKAEAEREEAKEKLEAVKVENVALKKDLEDHAEVIDQLSEELEEHAKVIDRITEEFDEVNAKYETVNETNKTLHQMIGELHESTSNENEVLRKEVEALRADKVIKDEQLNMLYTVIEHKLGFNVQAVFDKLDIQKVEARRVEREKRLAEEAKEKRKGLVVDTEEAFGSSSRPEGTEIDNSLALVPVGDVKDVTPEEIRLNRRNIIEKHREEEKKEEEDPELKEWFDDTDNYDGDDDDDDNDQEAIGLIVVKSFRQNTLDDFLNDELNEQQEDQHHEASSSLLNNMLVIRTRESMLEELGMEDGKFKFYIEDEIPPTPEREYSFKFVNEADNFKDVIIEENFDLSEEDTLFHYTGVDNSFPTLTKLFKTHNEDEVRRKVVERICTEGLPETVPQEELLEGRDDHPEKSLGDILSWGYLEDLKVYAIRREHGVQYFEFLSDIKTLPWWDVEELVYSNNITQFYYGLDVKIHDQKLWNYIKLQAKDKFPDSKPHFLEQVVKYHPITGEKDITLKIKPPKCLKNMPLRAMEQDFHEDFKGWLYNQSTAEAVISLFDKKTGETRRINVLDPMWLVNCSKKDIDCLFFNKIVYNEPDRVQAQQYQKMVNLCFAKDINSGRYCQTKFRDLELEEFLKKRKGVKDLRR